MNKLTLSILLSAAILSSCGNGKTGSSSAVEDSLAVSADDAKGANLSMTLEKSDYKKTDKYCEVKLSVQFPTGGDAVSAAIRKDLQAELDKTLAYDGENRTIAVYSKSDESLKPALDYYGAETFKRLSVESVDNHKVRVETEREFAKEQGEKFEMPDIAMYTVDMEIKREEDTERYIVFSLEEYTYSGGAHGMTGGVPGMTYSKADGKRFTDFLKPAMEKEIQPLVREGLIDYFSEQGEKIKDSELDDMLQYEGNMIPLPSAAPYPSSKGLVFCYGQYEVACYAAGRPTFTIPYAKVKPYLTQEAIALLGL